MNKNFYKTIFSKSRGEMIAVAENVSVAGQTSTTNNQTVELETTGTVSKKSLILKVLSFSLMLITGTALISSPIETTQANVVVDPNAAGNQRPTIMNSANGTTQVNIQTPTQGGVSVNHYQQFDVNQQGVILNNSRQNTNTQLGGYIQGNPWLAGGEAKVIVNQVNSSNPSHLNGYVEVGGRKADVIIANQAGINVDGGGFINAGGVTLSTANPNIQNGQVTGYMVRDGQINITGNGLDTSKTDYTQILSRAAAINAGVWANELTVVTGQNDVDASQQISAIRPTATSIGTAPKIAIDTSHLGGMYAGKINLVSTEKGVGINNAGQVFASAGSIKISANGEVLNSGAVVAQHKEDANQASLEIKGTDLNNSGTLSSLGQQSLNTENIQNSGLITTSAELNIRNQQTIQNSGELNAGRIDIETATLLNQSGKIVQTGLQDLAIDAKTLNNKNKGLIGYTEIEQDTGSGTGSGSGTGGAGNGSNSGSNNTAPSTATGGGSTSSANTLIATSFAQGKIKADNIENDAGKITANGGVDLTVTDSLSNTSSLNLKNFNINGDVFNNQNGELNAQRIQANVNTLNNEDGILRTNSEFHANIKHSLNNKKGQISSGKDINIHDDNRNTLTVDNSDNGKILAGENLSIQGKALDNKGTIVAGKDLAIAVTDSLDVVADLSAGQNLTLSSQQDIRNQNKITAGKELKLSAQNIDHQKTGELQSNDRLTMTSNTLVNRGLINSNGLTHLEVTEQLKNVGTGRIYGDHVAIATKNLINAEESIVNDTDATQVETKAAVIAARNRLDIGAKNILNQEEALISSGGDLAIGGGLDANKNAQGKADVLINSSARIEAQGNGDIAVNDLQNLNNHFEVEEYLASQKNVEQWAAPGSDVRFTTGIDGNAWDSEKYIQFNFTGNTNRYGHGSVAGITRWNYTQYEYDERIKNSKPGEIIIGGNLNISGDHWLNSDSQILVGGTLFGNDTNLIENKETLANHRIEEHGQSRHYYYHDGGFWGGSEVRSNSSSYNTETKWTDHFEQPAMVFETQSTQAQATGQAENTSIQSVSAKDGQIKTLEDFNTQLPNSSLFNTNPNNPEYLIETDSSFTNYKKWLGSDYMLQLFNSDPKNMHKRLGDGYYEQKLINDQVAKLTGYRRLEGYQSDEEQFKALMDSGVSFAQSMNLGLGVSLSAEQIARLTSDIVWLVNETVTLPDGSQQSVLVPKVYLMVREGDLNHAGALISANVVNLNNSQDIINEGAIAGRQLVNMSANTIENSGLIQSKAIQLTAQDQIKFEGGTAKAQDYLGLSADRIELNTTIQTTGDARNGNSTVDRVAGLYVTGAQDGILAVDAKKGIDAKGAVIANTSKDGKTQLRATEGSVNLSTVDISRQESYGQASDKNHRISGQTAEVGTTITTVGDASILANDKVNIRQGSINSTDGTVSIYGKQGVDITEGRATNALDQSVYSKSSGVLSSKTTLDQYQYKNNEGVASVITGKEIAIGSGQDLNIRGSQVVSQDLTQLSADKNINISATENTHENREFHQVKKSGLTGGLSDGVASVGYGKSNTKQEDKSQSTSLTQGVVGSVNGNTNIVAGEDLNIKASIVESGKDINLIGKNVNLDAADVTEDTQSKYEHKSSGISIGFTYSGVAAAVASAKKSKENSEFSDSAVGKIMSSAETVRKASMAAATPVVFQAHNQKVTKTKDTTSSQVVGTEVKAGGNLNIIATEGNIRAQAAKISAEGDALLHAKNNIDLLAGQNTESQIADSKRSGFSIDTRDHLAPLGVYNDKEKANGGLVQSVGTELSVGGKTTVKADEGNINIIGSKVVSTDDLILNAGKDVNIQSAQNSFNQSEDKKSKGWGSAQISDTERFDGYMANKNNTASESVSQERSQVGSFEGNVNITAGNNYKQKVADVVAGKDINITAKDISIVDDHNTGRDSQSSKDLKVGVFSRVSSPLLDLVNAVDKAGNSKADDRTQALQGLAAGAQAYQTANMINNVRDDLAKLAVDPNATGLSKAALFKAETGIGFSTSKNNQDNSYSASQGNVLNAGGNINLTSTEGDIHLKNTQVNAKDTIRLDSAKDILLESGQSTENADGKNSNVGAQIGVGVSVGAQTGVYAYAEVGYGKGSNHVDATTHQNTTLNADQIKITSKGDTTLKGAQATANRIDVDVGKNLNIISQQDTFNQDSKQMGVGARVQVSAGSAWDASGNFNNSSAKGNSKQVNQQSGLFAGDGG